MADSKTSILLSDVSIEGDVVEKDKVILDAKVSGDIKADEIITHSKSNIVGNIKSKIASLGGKLKGNVNSDKITVKKTANIEGVLNRFSDIVKMILRQATRDGEETVEKCMLRLEKIYEIKNGDREVEIILLDPMGHSQILHDDAISRELSEDEISDLEIGINIPIFNINNEEIL